MAIQEFRLTATHVDNGVWAIDIQTETPEGVTSPHPHSPFNIRVIPSYNRPQSITGLVLDEIAIRLLQR